MKTVVDAIDNDPTGTQPSWVLQKNTTQHVEVIAESGEIIALTVRGVYYGIVNDEVPMDCVVAYGWPYGAPKSTYINSHDFTADNFSETYSTGGHRPQQKTRQKASNEDFTIVIAQVSKVDLSKITTTRNADGSITQTGVTGKELITTTLNNPPPPPVVPFDWTWVIVGVALLASGIVAYFLYRHYSKKTGGEGLAPPSEVS
jgi:hypothetical protein